MRWYLLNYIGTMLIKVILEGEMKLTTVSIIHMLMVKNSTYLQTG